MRTTALVICLCCLAAGAPSIAAKYVLEDTTLRTYSVPTVINDRGQIAGFYEVGIGRYGFFFWDPIAGSQDMGFPPESHFAITGINNSGQVVGHWRGNGFVWDRFQGTRWLPKLIDATWSRNHAQGINDSGYIVGGATTPKGGAHAVWWGIEGNIHDLGGHGYSWTDSYDISNRGQIVGNANLNGIIHLLLWEEAGSLHDLGIPSGLFRVEPRAINGMCQIAGHIQTPLNRNRYAFTWDEEHGFELFLGTVADSYADDNNEHGQVVGECALGGYVWENGHVGYLNSLTENLNGGSIKRAYGINNYGLICAAGRVKGNPTLRSFLLRPIIEITVDIRPSGSEPAPVNLKSRGKLPVAIYGSAEFDVAGILPETVALEQAPAIRWEFGDLNGDGIGDILLHFPTQSLVLDATAQQAHLAGRTSHGQIICGSDYIRVVGS